ncbi:MAG: VRR-NUC domain-containing protein [Candidatus Hydrogenedentes bacterium]|nr:VRR-NUC domain-containing protein [Candidatus Hydrogenedentota bacterium]
MALERTAKELEIDLIHLTFEMGKSKKEWKSPTSGKWVLVEDAVLDHFKNIGWRGYSREGGLLLNLIKAMSFPKVDDRNRATYIEALYAKNVAFDEDKYEVEWLLKNVNIATKKKIRKNFKIMSSSKAHTWFGFGFSSTSTTSMLDFFPNLEEWMFIELYEALGNYKLREIAKIFAKNPYEYRKGWPDLTIWKNGKVKFLEVKSPGDRLHKSQKTIINDIIKPLNLDFSLVDVEGLM